MVHLAMRMYCNWPTDHAIDHSSVWLNRLTIKLLFNEVSLFTFSKETHGFDVTVPKNYLNSLLVTLMVLLSWACMLLLKVKLTTDFFKVAIHKSVKELSASGRLGNKQFEINL